MEDGITKIIIVKPKNNSFELTLKQCQLTLALLFMGFGSKFRNGILTGAFSRLYNDEHERQIQRTESKDSVFYTRGKASVLVQSDKPENGIPIVTMKQVRHVLDVSEKIGKQVQIVSGYRQASSGHRLYDVIDVYIKGYTTEQTAKVFYESGNFNRVSSYSKLNAAHADYKPAGNQGLFKDWVHQKD